MSPMSSSILSVILLALLAGCAGASSPISTSAADPAAPAAAGALSAEDQALDCGKLTGRMQVRLLQLRGYRDRNKASGIARTMQQVATPVFGGTSAGTDPDGRYAADVATLRAYNARLAELKCPTYDLEKELAAKPSDPTPQPVPLPKAR